MMSSSVIKTPVEEQSSASPQSVSVGPAPPAQPTIPVDESGNTRLQSTGKINTSSKQKVSISKHEDIIPGNRMTPEEEKRERERLRLRDIRTLEGIESGEYYSMVYQFQDVITSCARGPINLNRETFTMDYGVLIGSSNCKKAEEKPFKYSKGIAGIIERWQIFNLSRTPQQIAKAQKNRLLRSDGKQNQKKLKKAAKVGEHDATANVGGFKPIKAWTEMVRKEEEAKRCAPLPQNLHPSPLLAAVNDPLPSVESAVNEQETLVLKHKVPDENIKVIKEELTEIQEIAVGPSKMPTFTLTEASEDDDGKTIRRPPTPAPARSRKNSATSGITAKGNATKPPRKRPAFVVPTKAQNAFLNKK